jgi:hypothetical protein
MAKYGGCIIEPRGRVYIGVQVPSWSTRQNTRSISILEVSYRTYTLTVLHQKSAASRHNPKSERSLRENNSELKLLGIRLVGAEVDAYPSRRGGRGAAGTRRKGAPAAGDERDQTSEWSEPMRCWRVMGGSVSYLSKRIGRNT